MTKNEVNIIKNAVLDATEAYVSARLQVLDFVKTQIGVVESDPVKGTDGKFRHTVKCNVTSNPNTGNIIYNNVLSVGNVEFPKGSVVFLVAPNAQFSNQFILGKLDNTPCNIVGGSINIGDGKFTVDKNGNVYAKHIDIDVGGTIGGFNIGERSLQIDSTIFSKNIIGCGVGGKGIVNLVGGQSTSGTVRYGYIQISNSGDPTTCLYGIRIYGNGSVRYYEPLEGEDPPQQHEVWARSLKNIPT